MSDYGDKELETTFVRTRLDAGMTFDDVWAAWQDFHAKIHFIASQPHLPCYGDDGSDALDREERTRMRREARAVIGKHVRTDYVESLAMAARWLEVAKPSRQPSNELRELQYELMRFVAAMKAGEPAPPIPKTEAFIARFDWTCLPADAILFASENPTYVAYLFAEYVIAHDLGDLPFESQSRLFVKAFDEFMQQHPNEVPESADDLDLIDEKDDADPASPAQQIG